jgi:hypothetical protein
MRAGVREVPLDPGEKVARRADRASPSGAAGAARFGERPGAGALAKGERDGADGLV